jgi:tetratricopeptide (TPR) repeat protein
VADETARALADLLAAGEQAAFHGRPESGVQPLRQAVETAVEAGLQAEASAAGWLLGVCLASAGRYGAALTVLEPLVAVTEPPESKVLAALSGATVASVHRQLGRHAVAQGYDEMALAGSDGSGEAGFDAVLGLAADAVGLGEEQAATARLAEATALAEGRVEWWRQRVRLGWVRAEVALLGGRPDEAAAAAHEAVELAEHSGAPRHVAKGLLFLGVSQVEAGRPEEAAATLRRAALLAESLGTLPLQWPVRAVLGALVADVDAAESARCLDAARAAVSAIAADLPEPLRAEWLARPDVEALLSS